MLIIYEDLYLNIYLYIYFWHDASIYFCICILKFAVLHWYLSNIKYIYSHIHWISSLIN